LHFYYNDFVFIVNIFVVFSCYVNKILYSLLKNTIYYVIIFLNLDKSCEQEE